MTRTIAALTLVLLAVTVGCGGEVGDKAGAKADPVKEEPKNPLLDPKGEAMNETAPDMYKAVLETNKGNIVIQVHRDWTPNGADRFYNLVKNGYYDDCRFFRVVSGFMAQFGMHGDPEINKIWSEMTIPDDPVKKSNQPGMVTFAKSRAPDSRSTHIFINYKDNSSLDNTGFAPFGKVVEGMEVVEALYSGYGDAPPGGRGPTQGRIANEGNAYLTRDFPKLDYIKSARILEE
ncbi:MAG: peptidylprolyl isomerase [Planctomycetota bacterium]|jgi:peptidyl-prolyl cis-trans isomerase A (cyclophilin A)